MSTFPTDSGGFVIISQARPQNDQGDVPQRQSSNVPTNIPKPLATFYRGEPEVLGTVQIFVGILFIAFGVILWILCNKTCRYMEPIRYTYVFVWSGALYVISGSISLAASIKPTMGKVKSSLVMNMISIAAACYAILTTTTLFPSPLYYPLNGTSPTLYCAHYKPNTECIGAFNPMECSAGIIIFVFVLTVLVFCITISTSVFGGMTVCRSSYNEMSVIIYQSTSLNTPVATTEAPPPSTIMLDS